MLYGNMSRELHHLEVLRDFDAAGDVSWGNVVRVSYSGKTGGTSTFYGAFYGRAGI